MAPQRAAVHAYQRIWKQDRRFFGAAGRPAPRVKVNKGSAGAQASSGPGANGASNIWIGPATSRALAKGRGSARYTVEHELARIYQPDSVKSSSDANVGAGVANAVANRLARFRNTGKGNPKRYNRNHLPYFGQNPRTITWPSS